MTEEWVNEGPVELTDPARVSVEVDGGESRADDAEIIWDDPPGETAKRTDGNHGTVRARRTGTAPAEPADGSAETPARPTAGTARPVPRDNSAPVAGPPPPGTPIRDRKKARRARPAESERPITAQAEQGRAAPESRVRTGSASRGASRGEPEADLVEIEPERRISSRSALHRVLFVLVPLVIVLTVAWRYRQYRRAEYPLIAELGKTEGIPALDKGNFDEAFQRLSAAKAAVNALGGAVEDADEIRQAADESAIFVDLIPETLEQLLAEAGRTSSEAWASQFKTLYKGRSIIIDSWITATPESSPDGYDILYRVLPPGQPSNFVEGGAPGPTGSAGST